MKSDEAEINFGQNLLNNGQNSINSGQNYFWAE